MAVLSLTTTAVRFRWLIALLIALALVTSHLVPQNVLLSATESPLQVALLAEADWEMPSAQTSDADTSPERVAEFGDTYSGDAHHEIDKILSLFSFHWDAVVMSWAGFYAVAPAADPVFPFERPPKPLAV